MELVYRGAEAEIWKTDYLGIPAVLKARIPKKYRLPIIDERVRKARMKKEILMLIEAQAAVKAPRVLDVNQKTMTITLEFIDGEKVRDVFYRDENVVKTSKKIGESVRKLHDLGIIHNDLTTSNMILKDGEIYFIDFGLAASVRKEEDKAVDVLVFKKMIKSTHWKNFDRIWSAFREGYDDATVMEKVTEVEKRARYAEH